MERANVLRILTLTLLAFSLPLAGFSQSAELGQIATAIQGGNAKTLSTHFDNSVEVTILDQEGTYSRSQAEVIVRNFFDKYGVKGFRIIHKGESGGNSKYAIGKLESNRGTFRTYIYVKKKGDQLLIQQLRFEEE